MFDPEVLSEIRNKLIPSLPSVNIYQDSHLFEVIKIDFKVSGEKPTKPDQRLRMAELDVEYKEYNRKEDGSFPKFDEFGLHFWFDPPGFTHVFMCRAKLELN